MIDTINIYVLFTLIILAMFFDLTQKKIPNLITFPVIIWALLSYTVFGGFEGIKFTIFGFVVGFVLYLIPFILGGMGAGDVKMMAAIGALMGWLFIVKTAIASGLVGGVMVIIYLIYKKQFVSTFKKILGVIMRPILFALTVNFNSKTLDKAHNYFLRQEKVTEKYYIPYGVAIGIGAIIVYFAWGEIWKSYWN